MFLQPLRNLDSVRSPLRILQVNATRPNTIGGLQTVAEMLKTGLQQRGHTVTQVSFGDRFVQCGPDLWEIHLVVPTTRRRLPTVGSVLCMIHSAAKLCALLWTVRPQVVYFNYATWATAYFVALRPIFRYRLVVTVHGSDLSTRWPLARAVLPYVLRSADAVTAVSEHLRERALEIQIRKGPSPIRIQNGVDSSFWTPGETSSPVRPTMARPTIVSVGRLHPVKGHDVLIEAFARVQQSLPDAHLTLLGDGPERPALVEQATRLGVRSAVSFTGFLDPLEIREHLRQAAVFALPSRTEGLPVALLEAMATGTPAVASDVGGISNVLATGGGFVVPPDDPRALADPLVRVLSDPGLRERTGRAALERAQEYAPAHVLDTYERVLSSLAAASEGSVRSNTPKRPAPQHGPQSQASRSFPPSAITG